MKKTKPSQGKYQISQKYFLFMRGPVTLFFWTMKVACGHVATMKMANLVLETKPTEVDQKDIPLSTRSIASQQTIILCFVMMEAVCGHVAAMKTGSWDWCLVKKYFYLIKLRIFLQSMWFLAGLLIHYFWTSTDLFGAVETTPQAN